MITDPLLKWPGAKWQLARWIVGHFPPHKTYLEPFAGSLAALFAKTPAHLETVNDLDHDIATFWRVCRDDSDKLARALSLTPWSRAEHAATLDEPATAPDDLERARRFAVRCWQSYGARVNYRQSWRHSTGRPRAAGGLQHYPRQWAALPDLVCAVAERLRRVQIECRPALEVLARYNHPDCLVFADPPYPFAARADPHDRFYRHELRDEDHRELRDALGAHAGPVILSGYHCPLYDNRLVAWRAVERKATAEGGRARVEVLWLNRAAAEQTAARQIPLVDHAD